MSKKDRVREKNIGILSSIGENSEFLDRVQTACDKASDNISQRVSELGNMRIDQAQGLFAEVWHAETFNADTVLNRMRGVHAEVLKSNGYKSVDVAVTNDGKTVAKYSLKYYKSAKASVDAQKGYGDQNRLIPSEQLKKADEYYKRQIHKDLLAESENRSNNAQELQDMQGRTTGTITYGKAESVPLSRKESEGKIEKVRNEGEIGIQPQIDLSKIAEESLRSGAVAAGITIGMTVAPRIFNSIVFRCKEGEWPHESLEIIFKETGTAGSVAFLRGSIATSLTMSAKAGLLGEAMRTVNPTIIGTLTCIAFEGAKDFKRYSDGELTGELMADSLMGKSVAAGAGAYGAAIGQVLIPVPVLGAMIGATFGSIVAQNGYQFLDTVSGMYFRSKEFEQLKEANIAISEQWGGLLNGYINWRKHDQCHQEQMAAIRQRNEKLDAQIAQIDDQLFGAAGDSDE